MSAWQQTTAKIGAAWALVCPRRYGKWRQRLILQEWKLGRASPQPGSTEYAKQHSGQFAITIRVPVMSNRQGRIYPNVVTVQSLAQNLDRVEALIIEMRHTQDVQLKQVGKLQAQLDGLAATPGTGKK
jgi:hypothetical protein